MTIHPWQLHSPIDTIIFDCDGTLATIEGIDELAKHKGVGNEVASLTAKAMGQSGLNPDLYQKRLALVDPKKTQVYSLGHQYFANQTPDANAVIQLLKRLGKTIYLVSAGLYPAVKIFGELLQIPEQNIYAVDIQFDTEGNFIDYEKTSPLVTANGKRVIVNELKKNHPELLYVGDGLNDYVTYDLVTRFVGYGGIFYRENMAKNCEYYIRTASLSALLPLAITQFEYEHLLPNEQALYHAGLATISAPATI